MLSRCLLQEQFQLPGQLWALFTFSIIAVLLLPGVWFAGWY